MKSLLNRVALSTGLLFVAVALFVFAWFKEPMFAMQKIKLTFLPQYKSLGLSYYSENEGFYNDVLDILKSGRAVILTKDILLKKDGENLSAHQQKYTLKYRLLDNKYLLLDQKVGAEVAIGEVALKGEVLGTHRLWMQTDTNEFKGNYLLKVNYQMEPENEKGSFLGNLYAWRMHKDFVAEGNYEVLE